MGLAPEDIYPNFHGKAKGTQSLQDAHAGVQSIQTKLQQRAVDIARVNDTLRGGWQGNAADSATSAIAPIAQAFDDTSTSAASSQQLIQAQAQGFHDTAAKVKPLPAESGVGDYLGGIVQDGWDVMTGGAPVNTVTAYAQQQAYNATNDANVAAVNQYHSSSTSNAAFPTQTPKLQTNSMQVGVTSPSSNVSGPGVSAGPHPGGGGGGGPRSSYGPGGPGNTYRGFSGGSGGPVSSGGPSAGGSSSGGPVRSPSGPGSPVPGPGSQTGVPTNTDPSQVQSPLPFGSLNSGPTGGGPGAGGGPGDTSFDPLMGPLGGGSGAGFGGDSPPSGSGYGSGARFSGNESLRGGQAGAGAGGEAGPGGRTGASPGAGAAVEQEALRGGSAGAAGRGGMPMGTGRGGRKEEDSEHKTPEYLVTDEHGSEIVGTLPKTAPPVIGE